MANNPFVLTFKLKQHTPIIHFQHDQEGATLRATEVKPKLDKFLIEKMGGWSKIPDEWKVGEGNSQGNPLNYKMYVESTDSIIELIEQPIKDEYGEYQLDRNGKPKVLQMPGYFGNMGVDIRDESRLKKFVLSGTVSIRIVSFNTKLIGFIQKHLPEFFATHNFGNRQTKGFGSFYLQGEEKSVSNFVDYRFLIDTTQFSLPNHIQIQIKERSSEYQVLFKLFYAINVFYNSLRSGLNIPGLYFKSLMFMYAKSKNIQWDKKSIRDHFHLYSEPYKKAERIHTDPEGTFRYSSKKKRLMRDILGLSTEQSWLAYGDTITKESVVREDDKPCYARWASPILFKVIRIQDTQFDVFLVPRKIPEEIFGQEFIIRSKVNSSREPLHLAMPSSEEFDLDEFIAFCFHEVFSDDDDAFDQHVNYSSSREVILLKSIYEQLRNC